MTWATLHARWPELSAADRRWATMALLAQDPQRSERLYVVAAAEIKKGQLFEVDTVKAWAVYVGVLSLVCTWGDPLNQDFPGEADTLEDAVVKFLKASTKIVPLALSVAINRDIDLLEPDDLLRELGEAMREGPAWLRGSVAAAAAEASKLNLMSLNEPRAPVAIRVARYRQKWRPLLLHFAHLSSPQCLTSDEYKVARDRFVYNHDAARVMKCRQTCRGAGGSATVALEALLQKWDGVDLYCVSNVHRALVELGAMEWLSVANRLEQEQQRLGSAMMLSIVGEDHTDALAEVVAVRCEGDKACLQHAPVPQAVFAAWSIYKARSLRQQFESEIVDD